MIVLPAVGAYAATTTFRLAALLPYAPVALALAALLRDPLAYAITVYLVGLAEAMLAAILLAIPGNSQKARKTVRSSLKCAPVFPIVLWTSVIAVMAGIPYALYRIATGKSQARWSPYTHPPTAAIPALQPSTRPASHYSSCTRPPPVSCTL